MKQTILYQFLLGCIFATMTITQVSGQQLRSFSQDFVYTENAQRYQGSFRYECFTRTKKGVIDLLATRSVDFGNNGVTEIWINVKELKLDPRSSQDLKLFLLADKHRYSKAQLEPYLSARERMMEMKNRSNKYIKVGGRAQNLPFTVLKNGGVKLAMAYHIGKDATNPTVNYLRFGFSVKGIEGVEDATVEEEQAEVVSRGGRSRGRRGERKETPVDPASSTNPVVETQPVQPPQTEPVPPTDNTLPPKEEPAEKTPEEIAWEVAEEKATILAYQSFINTYPNHRLSRQATAAINKLRAASPMEITVHQRKDNFTILFENAMNPKITDMKPEMLFWKMVGDSIQVLIEKRTTYTLTIEDEQGKTKVIEIDNEAVELEGEIKTEKGNLVYKAAGGVPPYSLVIKDEDNITVSRVNLEGAEGKLAFKQLGAGLNGVFTVDLFDEKKVIAKTFEGIKITQKVGQHKLWLFLGLAGGVTMLFFIARYFYQKLHEDDNASFDDDDDDEY